MSEAWKGPLEKVDEFRWMIPQSYQSGMKVPGLIFADEHLLSQIRKDQSPQQVANSACLPGIVGMSLAMPDIHSGYGLPIGGVVAVDAQTGVISPGGVGYDINCGVRLVRTNLKVEDIKKYQKGLVETLFRKIPCGVGSTGNIKVPQSEWEQVLTNGVKWAIGKGYGWDEDTEVCEEGGALVGADPDAVSNRSKERGRDQLGTLGSGNHFIEIQIVNDIYDEPIAEKFGFFKGQVCVMIHSGSRGFGYQICDDYVESMGKAMQKYGIVVPDRQLACAPVNSEEGKRYFKAMCAAANYGWANRQCIMHWARESFQEVLGVSSESLGMHLIYDVAHNIAKFEEHTVAGKKMRVCVHRKGATRAFPAGHQDIPTRYKDIGQPVLIPGDMGTASYLLVGTDRAMAETFGSTCHGAGRVLSRTQAIKVTQGRPIARELEDRGIVVRSRGRDTLREEAPEAYKDVDAVVEVVHKAGISKKVIRLKPIGVVKG